LISQICVSPLLLQLTISLLFDILRISPLLVVLVPTLTLQLLLLTAVDLFIPDAIVVIARVAYLPAALIPAIAPRILLLTAVVDTSVLVVVQLSAIPASGRLNDLCGLIRYRPAIPLRKVLLHRHRLRLRDRTSAAILLPIRLLLGLTKRSLPRSTVTWLRNRLRIFLATAAAVTSVAAIASLLLRPLIGRLPAAPVTLCK